MKTTANKNWFMVVFVSELNDSRPNSFGMKRTLEAAQKHRAYVSRRIGCRADELAIISWTGSANRYGEAGVRVA